MTAEQLRVVELLRDVEQLLIGAAKGRGLSIGPQASQELARSLGRARRIVEKL